MNPFLPHLSARIDATAADLKTSLHEHVDSTVDGKLSQFKVEFASLVRSGVIERICSEGRNQHWKVETTYTPVSAHSRHPSGDVLQMPNHSTSFIEGIPPPLLTEEASSSGVLTDKCIADVTFPSGLSVSIPLYNVHEINENQHESQHISEQSTYGQLPPSEVRMHSPLLANDNLDTTEQANTSPSQSVQQQTSNNEQQNNTEPLESYVVPLAQFNPNYFAPVLHNKDPSTNAPNVILNIKTESIDSDCMVVKREIEEEDDHDDDCDGCDRCRVKRELVSDDDDDEEVDNDGQEIQEEEEEKDGETQINGIEGWTDANQGGGDDESRSLENAEMDTTRSHPTEQSQTNVRKSAKRQREEPQLRNKVNNRDNPDMEEVEDEEEEREEDDTDEGTSHQVKRPRPSHPNQIITHDLQCSQVGCGLTFTNDKLLNKHLKEQHSIEPFRCLVRDCTESFNHTRKLAQHLAQSHRSITQWHCGKCISHFATHNQLSNHNSKQHQLGHFQCSFALCDYTAEHRSKVSNHYRQHNNVLACDRPGCQYRTSNGTNFKRHQRSHLDIKSYRCTWPGCEYAAAERAQTIRHIRRLHLAQDPGADPNDAQLADPKNYVEFVQ